MLTTLCWNFGTEIAISWLVMAVLLFSKMMCFEVDFSILEIKTSGMDSSLNKDVAAYMFLGQFSHRFLLLPICWLMCD